MKYTTNTYRSRILNTTWTFSSKSVFIGLLVLFSQLLFFDSQGQNPFIPKYDAVKRSERCFTVTWEANNQFGAVWWADKVNFSQDTSFNFVVYMGDRDGNGADGLAFVMHQDPRDTITDGSQTVTIGGAGTWDLEAATGDDGGGLGFAMHTSREGPNTIPGPHGPGDDPENHKIQPSVSVEMDTWNNSDVPDGNSGTDANGVNQPTSTYYGWDHTAVIYNGDLYGGQQVIEDAKGNTGRILPLKPSYAFGSSNNPDGSAFHNIEDDRCYMFQIKWITNPDGTQTLQLWADVYNGTTNTDGLQMIMTHTDDMINNVFGGNSLMRFGFTGSTGGSINEQTICLLGENLKPFAENDYASIPLNTTAVIDVEANDNDPDGDQLHVPIIIDQARNGQAAIFDSLGTNYMRYTPNTNYVGLDTIGYVTCDVNSTKCYAKCDTAFVFIDIGCVPFDILVNATSANTVCSVTVPANGSAEAIINGSALSGTLWYEGFEDLSDGTTSDNGTSGWSISNTGSCNNDRIVQVEGNQFRARKTGCEIVYETEIIDISGVSNVNIRVDLLASGDMENDDYLQAYYKLDGGSEIALNNGLQNDNFGATVASVNNINGNNIQIVIRAYNTGNDENYYWDNIHVTAIGAGVPNVTFNWYQGTSLGGPIVFTGTSNSTMNHGQYTVQAIDNNTGCPSNPFTVTIDSTGYQLSGGFIEQRSPFTNCTLPFDGELGAGIFNGTDTITTGYTFEWYFQEDPKLPAFIQRTGAIAQNLESREFTVIITENATGCDTTINAEVPNEVSIPVLNVTKLADVTSCSDPNSGAATASIGGITNGYIFEWYAGPSIGSGPPNYTGNTVNTLPIGTFAVQAIDNITLCPSDPATVTINDLTTTPDILVYVDSEQISCDPATPTGQLSGAVDDGGAPTTTGFTFNWYKGQNDIIPARPGYSGGPTADSLEIGTYRLVVIEDATNCTAFVDTLVQDMTIAIPDITINSTDVTSCAAPNGTITVTLDPSLNASDFEFEVYRGNGIIEDSLLTTSSTPFIENLEDGNYTVIAVDIVTACSSNPVSTTILDATQIPDANILSQPQVSCDTNNFTGSLTVSMGSGAITDYTYEWFDESGNSLTSSSVDGEILSNLDSGNYEVRIIEDISQCTNIYFPVVNIAQVFPVETVSAVASTHCAPSGNGVLNGGVQGQSAPYTGYTFLWKSATTGPLGTSAFTVNGLEPGDYSLQVQDDNTKCFSNIAPVIVYDSTVTPIPTLIPTDNTSCDINNPNGQIEVTETNETLGGTALLTDYSYAWFDNSNNDPQTDVSGSGEIVNSLNAGTYRLEILNTSTSCSNSTLAIINNVNIKPVIDNVDVTDATRCADPYMSGAVVTSISGSAVLTDFTFTWVNTDLNDTLLSASTSPIISDATDADGFEMPPGNYSVTAFNSYGCPSDPVPFVIGDNTTPPVFSVTPFNNISCDLSDPVGILVASRPDDSYNILEYEWFDATSSVTNTDSIRYNLPAGLYGVIVTDNATACTSVEYATILYTPASEPNIQNISAAGLTSCAIPNGELGYQVFPYDSLPPFNLTARNYTFHIEKGADSYSLNTAGLADSVNFTGLSAGDWEAWVVDDYTHCESDKLITNLSTAPDIIIETAILSLPATCNDNDGVASVIVESKDGSNKDPLGPGFDFKWFLGTDTLSSIFNPNITVSSNWSREANNFGGSKYYTVKVKDKSTQCEKDTTFFVPPDVTPVFINVNPVNATQCDPADGELTAQVDPLTLGFGKDYTDYYYVMFEGTHVDLSWSVPLTTEYILVNGDTIDLVTGTVDFGNEIEPGIYSIIAVEKAGNQCFGEPFITEIGLDFDFPDFAFAITPDKSCTGGTPTGQIEENSVVLFGNIDYSWHYGTDSGDPQVSTTNVTSASSNSLYGNYYLTSKIINNLPSGGLGCIQDSIISIPKVLDLLQITGTPTPNENCAPNYTGEIVVDQVVINSINSGWHADFADYTLLASDMSTIVPAPIGDGTANPWEQLEPGTYYIKARNTSTNCWTNSGRVVVDDDSENPEVIVSMVNPDFGCDPTLLQNGILAASVNGMPASDYIFEWTDGLGLSIMADTAYNLTADNGQKTYTVTVTDNAGTSLGCTTTRDMTLVHQPTTVFILSPTIDVLPQTNCAPANGSIEIPQIEEDDGSAVNSYFPDYSGAYSARLLNNSLNPIGDSFANFNPVSGFFGATNIPSGSYYVQASNETTGCAFGPITQVIVKDISRKPIISAILTSPDYSCVGGTPTGELVAVYKGGSDGNQVSTNFDVDWTLTGTSTSPAGGDTAIDLPDGSYTLTVIDKGGVDLECAATRDFLVPIARHNIEVIGTGTDQTYCDPNGLVQIDEVIVDGVNVAAPESSTFNGLLLDISRNNLNAPESGFTSDGTPFENISGGSYFVQIQDRGTKCYSNTDLVVVDDLSTDPVISMTVDNPQWSLNPNPVSWTGALSAVVQEADNTIGNYTINWYEGIGTINAINENALSADSLDQGIYTFEAENDITGCVSKYYIYLPYEYLEPTFLTAQTPKTICAPNNGAIEVTEIELDGDSDELVDYTFDFYDHSYNQQQQPDAEVPGNNSGTYYRDINTGSYYIIARENWWLVESYPVKVEVLDSTTNPIITFDATNYQAITSCDQSIFANGTLGVEIYEDINNPYVQSGLHEYSYTWIDESTGQIIPGENNNTISGLQSGEYTVVVVNLDNNCESEGTFVIDDESIIPVVVTNQSPNTNCEITIANGIVDANVINSTNDYYYNWYEGSEITNSPAFQGQVWRGRPSGVYTIVAVDNELYTCISEPVTVEVEDATENPVVLINEVAPVTHCDPERPDGILSAVTENGVSGHTFEWYLDGKLEANGPIASDLGLYDYELVVINNVTLCKTSMIAGPTALLGIVAPPDVDILSDRTSCLNPDGQATATIDGNVVDYIFRYYNKYSGEELNNLYQNYVIHDLDTSAYLVTAENRETGCVSDPTEFAIANATYFPEIDVIAKPSSCMEPSGEANVIISDMTKDFSVTWIGDNGYEAQEKEIVFIPIGKYQVIVEGTDGCTTEAEAEVKGDVIIYNAISANFDGLNEFFQILCMEYFLDNNVKIYNRAGLLVYEQDNYDPTDPSRRFEGTSNKGASIAGTELPIGTYFYVVDKNDGTKPKVGYLELNR